MTDTTIPVIFYIDGFNFYFGLRNGGSAWKRFYWIDIVKLCESFLKENEKLVCVKYYTARPRMEDKRERQNTLMKVNKGLNNHKLKIHYGKYTEKEITCRGTCKETFPVWEEKQTDVHIAVDILEDYMTDKCVKSILVSADSDLIPPIKSIIRLEKSLSKKHMVEILFPPQQSSSAMRDLGISVKQMVKYRSRFNRALLPYEVKLPGKKVKIPDKWRRELEASSKSHGKL